MQSTCKKRRKAKSVAGLLNLHLFFKAVVNGSKSSEGGKAAGAVVLQQVSSSPLAAGCTFPFSQGGGGQDLGTGIPTSFKRRPSLKTSVETWALSVGMSAWEWRKAACLPSALVCQGRREGDSVGSRAEATPCVKPHPSHAPGGSAARPWHKPPVRGRERQRGDAGARGPGLRSPWRLRSRDASADPRCHKVPAGRLQQHLRLCRHTRSPPDEPQGNFSPAASAGYHGRTCAPTRFAAR